MAAHSRTAGPFVATITHRVKSGSHQAEEIKSLERLADMHGCKTWRVPNPHKGGPGDVVLRVSGPHSRKALKRLMVSGPYLGLGDAPTDATTEE